MSENLYAILADRFSRNAQRVALETEDGQQLTYADLEKESARIARYLIGLGLEAGDRVACSVEKSPMALCVYLGCLRAGLVYLPLNTAYQRSELAHFIGDAQPRAIICRPQVLAMMRELAPGAKVETLDERGEGSLSDALKNVPPRFESVERKAEDLAAILYTSGTSGVPKGVMLTHRNLAVNALALVQVWRFDASDVLLHMLPIFHVHGLFVANHCALLSGAKMFFLSRFDAAKAVRFLPRSTVFMGVPTYYTRLLAEPKFTREVCRNMRVFISGSAPLLVDTFEKFKERAGHEILERYGMTETGIISSNPVDGPRIPGTVGLPLPGVSVRVVDEQGHTVAQGTPGNVQVKGENVFPGYWRLPDKTAAGFTADGFFDTGDVGQLGANGYLSIVGRAKDMIISGGYNVYPKEVEAAIDRIEGVAESAVFGVPHPDFGEAVVAAVVPRDKASVPSEREIIARLKTELANYKVPKRVFFVDSLPRNAMDKVQKKVLSERYKDLTW